MAKGDAYATAQEWQNSFFWTNMESYFTSDEEIDLFLLNVSDLINGYCRRHFWPDEAIDKFSGNNTTNYFLKNYPVTSIDNFIYIQKFTDNATSGVITSDKYEWTRSGTIEYKCPFSNLYNYQIEYSFGYETVPAEIKTACLMYANHLVLAVDNGSAGLPNGASLSSFKFDRYQETFIDGTVFKANFDWDKQLPPTIAGILKKYRRGGV